MSVQKNASDKKDIRASLKKFDFTQFFLTRGNQDISRYLEKTLAPNFNKGLTMKAARQFEQSPKLTVIGQDEPFANQRQFSVVLLPD